MVTWSEFLPTDRQSDEKLQSYGKRKMKCTNTSFESGLIFDSFPYGPLFFFPRFKLFNECLHSESYCLKLCSKRHLYTPVHIIEPTPSVLIPSRSSLSQTVAETMSVQFANHFKWDAPASLHQCSIFPSQRGRLLTPTPPSLISPLRLHFSS